MIKSRKPLAVHPGEIINEILNQNGLSQSAVARHLRITHARVNEVCRGKRGISPDLAMKLGRAFGQNPTFWMNLQKNWELSQLNAEDYEHIEQIKLRA